MKKIIIIGLGKHSLSQIKLLREYRPDIAVSWLVDNSIASYYRCINHFNNELNSLFSTSISDVLSCDPDLIYISTLADSHVEIANQLITMGFEKKIIIEKPVSNNLIKAKKLKNKIQESNWKGNIYVGFYRRFNSLFKRIKDITLEKKLGALKSIEYFNSVELSMNGSHWIDFANWLIDDDLQDISSRLYWNQEPGRRGSRIIDPICNLKIKYKNNIIFNIHKTESIDKEKLIELNFENGKIHGFGVMTFGNSYRYEGNWKDGQRHGLGKVRYKDGTTYEGEFKEGQRSGSGSMKMRDGFVYSGQWLSGEMHGSGIARYANGDVYEGNFFAGRRQGQGSMKYATGSIENGLWTEGELNSGGATETEE